MASKFFRTYCQLSETFKWPSRRDPSGKKTRFNKPHSAPGTYESLFSFRDIHDESNSSLIVSSINLPSNHSDYKSMTVSILQMDRQAREGRTEEPSSFTIQALLDTGSLAGDFFSQHVVDKLNANLLLTSVNTTVCSGLNNQSSV
jgi:hypothetical protein